MTEQLRAGIETATGRGVRQATSVRGGDTSTAFRVEFDNGELVFAKTHASPPPGFFTTEAIGLEWLREAAAVAVPKVVAVNDSEPALLVLEWIEQARSTAAADADFGAALARLHQAGAPCFGREDRRTTGSLGLPNEPSQRWSSFVASCRFLPLARLAHDSATLPTTTITQLERLAATLDRFDDGQRPARLHGDLWAGNRMVDVHGQSWLIDPACHGGHREFDLAMMRLFGGYSQDCFRTYEECYRLNPGWRERVDLHQIAPLVVHAIKFGGHYATAAADAIGRY